MKLSLFSFIWYISNMVLNEEYLKILFLVTLSLWTKQSNIKITRFDVCLKFKSTRAIFFRVLTRWITTELSNSVISRPAWRCQWSASTSSGRPTTAATKMRMPAPRRTEGTCNNNAVIETTRSLQTNSIFHSRFDPSPPGNWTSLFRSCERGSTTTRGRRTSSGKPSMPSTLWRMWYTRSKWGVTALNRVWILLNVSVVQTNSIHALLFITAEVKLV